MPLWMWPTAWVVSQLLLLAVLAALILRADRKVRGPWNP